jgi:hypothetical protein
MSERVRARVRIDTRSLRRLRISTSLTRWVAYAAAGTGIAACVRFAVAPPHPASPRSAPPVVADVGAEGFAALFARRYLTWFGAAPGVHRQGLAAFVGGGIDPDAGLAPPPRGSQRVTWVEVVQARPSGPGEHVYTVAADTGGTAPDYLSVDVVRDASGALRLGRYPALVGPPLVAAASSLEAGAGAAVADAGVSTVVERALGNYLAGSAQNLAADLAPGSVVATPVRPLALDRVADLRAVRGGGVLATVGAHDAAGTSYTLTYQLDLRSSGGRWLVGAIQSDPRT